MDKFLLQKEPESKRATLLKNSCDRVQDFHYMKQFTPEEISSFKNALSDVMITLDSIESELQEVKDEFKERMKPMKDQLKEFVSHIRDKAESVKEECYVFYTGEMAGYYNGKGELVWERPLEPMERQTTVFSILRKTGTEEE